MKIHEYQAKFFLAQYGIPVPRGQVVTEPAEAKKIASELGGKVVIKAQVYAGGRGKAGGIKIANNPGEAEIRAGELPSLPAGQHHREKEWGMLVPLSLAVQAEPKRKSRLW